MSAPNGNQFWKARSSHGANPKFKDGDELWSACTEYFEWVDDNPLKEEKIAQFQGEFVRDTVEKMRAMTISGLCIFLNITTTTWKEWRTSRDDLSAVINMVDDIIRTQKFEGASANLLNANIIARDLGLSDKSEVTGADGAPLMPDSITFEPYHGEEAAEDDSEDKS